MGVAFSISVHILRTGLYSDMTRYNIIMPCCIPGEGAGRMSDLTMKLHNFGASQVACYSAL